MPKTNPFFEFDCDKDGPASIHSSKIEAVTTQYGIEPVYGDGQASRGGSMIVGMVITVRECPVCLEEHTRALSNDEIERAKQLTFRDNSIGISNLDPSRLIPITDYEANQIFTAIRGADPTDFK